MAKWWTGREWKVDLIRCASLKRSLSWRFHYRTLLLIHIHKHSINSLTSCYSNEALDAPPPSPHSTHVNQNSRKMELMVCVVLLVFPTAASEILHAHSMFPRFYCLSWFVFSPKTMSGLTPPPSLPPTFFFSFFSSFLVKRVWTHQILVNMLPYARLKPRPRSQRRNCRKGEQWSEKSKTRGCLWERVRALVLELFVSMSFY